MSADTPIRVTGVRQLFVDDALIASTDLARTFHKPKLHPASPVMQPRTPLEFNGGVMPATALASVFYDDKGRLFKMWYGAGYDGALAYAYSEDGIDWVRPELDVVPGTNRVLEAVPGYVRNGATVWLDTDARLASERYKMLVFYRAGTGSWPRTVPQPPPVPSEFACVYTSGDGIHWERRARTGPCGDNTSFFFDPHRGLWCFSIRVFGGAKGRLRGAVEHPDFVQGAGWTQEQVRPWLQTDAQDRPDPQLQWMPELYKVDCAAYESIMVGLFGIYLGPPNHVAGPEGIAKTVDLHLGFSRGGGAWSRPERTAFIACSRQEEAWDRAYLQPSPGVYVTVGDELWFYFSAFSGVSPAQGSGPYAGGSIGIARLRRDGFASMDGPGIRMPAVNSEGARDRQPDLAAAAGVLVTQPLLLEGRTLCVNACVLGGAMRVELLDTQGAVIPGFAAADCRPMTGDSTCHTVGWSAAAISGLSGQAVRLRFWLAAGELYSFWVEGT